MTAEERQQLEAWLHSSDAFTLRRGQILLANSGGQRPAQIARNLGCATQSVLSAIRTLQARGRACGQKIQTASL
jgi:DNA-binding CsgD family transcriptional regulator